MPEETEIPFTGDQRVDEALIRIRGKFRDLEDAMIVQAHLEKRQSESIRALAEDQDRLAAAIKRHDVWLKDIEEKITALTDLPRRRNGGGGTEAHG